MRGWRPALRLAWRDVARSKGRSLLVLALITLPVLAVTAAAVVQATADVSAVDAIPRKMGAAQARVQPVGGVVVQSPDPSNGQLSVTGRGDAPTRSTLTEVLGDRDVITIDEGYAEVVLDKRAVPSVPVEVDLRDPLSHGLFELHTGELPGAAGDVVVNEAAAERGVEIGDRLEVLGESVEVVGIGRDATHRETPTVTGPPGTFGRAFASDDTTTDWLVGGDPVLWSNVRDLNERGALVFSRAVITDPPEVEDVSAHMDDGSSTYITVAALVVAMALLEVVLLAGPAFAVGARRQARTLALIAASGGTPRQARRVVLGTGVVLGTIAALVGAVVGVVLGLGLVPLVQRFSGVWFGPVEVNWLVVAIVAAFGLLSAFLAALVPAWLASRQDVVAVLAGRRGDPPPSARTPALGFVLLGVGVALSVIGVKGGELAIAFGAVVSVLGMVFVVPLVVGAVGRLARRLPLVMRYAVRDAARHRTRTVPAIAAVAATVAGVVALGIANSSDEAENRATYVPELPMGVGVVTLYSTSSMGSASDVPSERAWADVEAVVRGRVEDEGNVEVVRGLPFDSADGATLNLEFQQPGRGREDALLEGWGGRLGASVVVADTAPSFLGLDDQQRATVSRSLSAGRAVVFASRAVSGDEVRVRAHSWDPATDESGKDDFTWPAAYVRSAERYPAAQAILPTVLAAELDTDVMPAGILIGETLSTSAEESLDEALGSVAANSQLYVERGYQAPDEVFILLLILFTLGAVLMLGGTLTATFLALADAKPDLATLAAVGAAPRARRGVAASYALMVGVIGAVLGTIVGFIPGVAITYPLTTMGEGICTATNNVPLVCESGPYLDIPWLMILGLVVVLPLLTALIVGLTARSRLPLAARLT
ncbi:FtsX-like permease family protein [Nocardioides piscis]|uniref:FtsX-like permease family protein n=1 Tax=Nocardioides piscis TaxID=2714938 RepID=A0A6G7YEJ0_9ACTN|nr:FtsX-like permease family protein [Nocardioides piscis]QIK75027.1 FtsX-like permease family protein [Nocardioides piscis]